MKKCIGLAVLALGLFACSGTTSSKSTTGGSGSSGGTGSSGSSGSSGTTGTSSGNPGSLQGPLAFGLSESDAVFFSFPDGGLDPTYVQIDGSDDSSDACLVQVAGYGDGGGPAPAHFMQVVVQDPNGLQSGTAYPSVTQQQLDTYRADGGFPANGFAQVVVAANGSAHGSVGGSVTVTIASNTITAALSGLTMAAPDGGDPSALSGTLTPPGSCTFQAQ